MMTLDTIHSPSHSEKLHHTFCLFCPLYTSSSELYCRENHQLLRKTKRVWKNNIRRQRRLDEPATILLFQRAASLFFQLNTICFPRRWENTRRNGTYYIPYNCVMTNRGAKSHGFNLIVFGKWLWDRSSFPFENAFTESDKREMFSSTCPVGLFLLFIYTLQFCVLNPLASDCRPQRDCYRSWGPGSQRSKRWVLFQTILKERIVVQLIQLLCHS